MPTVVRAAPAGMFFFDALERSLFAANRSALHPLVVITQMRH